MRSLDRMHIGQKLAILGGLVTLLFLVPTLLAWLVIGLIAGSIVVPLLMALAIGVSAAAGRLAVWRLMDVRY